MPFNALNCFIPTYMLAFRSAVYSLMLEGLICLSRQLSIQINNQASGSSLSVFSAVRPFKLGRFHTSSYFNGFTMQEDSIVLPRMVDCKKLGVEVENSFTHQTGRRERWKVGRLHPCRACKSFTRESICLVSKERAVQCHRSVFVCQL